MKNTLPRKIFLPSEAREKVTVDYSKAEVRYVVHATDQGFDGEKLKELFKQTKALFPHAPHMTLDNARELRETIQNQYYWEQYNLQLGSCMLEIEGTFRNDMTKEGLILRSEDCVSYFSARFNPKDDEVQKRLEALIKSHAPKIVNIDPTNSRIYRL